MFIGTFTFLPIIALQCVLFRNRHWEEARDLKGVHVCVLPSCPQSPSTGTLVQVEAPTAVLMAQSAAGCFFLNPELAAL